MEEKIKQKCDKYGISPEILTEREMALLRKEIEKQESGIAVLDSVLDDPDIHQRQAAQ